ncbi:hypothetical protein SS209_04416 [Salmonella enterica subsp. enterica serovar Senftenberg str. SS209]|jgi:hypothetical protein
MMD